MVISYTEFIWLWSKYLKLRKCDQYTKALENWVWSDLYLIHNHRYALAGLSILIFSELASSTPLTVFIWQFKFQQSAEEYRKTGLLHFQQMKWPPPSCPKLSLHPVKQDVLLGDNWRLTQVIDNSKDRNSRLQTNVDLSCHPPHLCHLHPTSWLVRSLPFRSMGDNIAIKITTQSSSTHRWD